MPEDEMAGWHHQLNGHEFEQTPGDGKGKGSLACWSPCGCKELDMTESLCCITEIKHNIANQLYLNKIKKQNQKNPKDLSSELTLLLSKEIKPVGLKRDQP